MAQVARVCWTGGSCVLDADWTGWQEYKDPAAAVGYVSYMLYNDNN